MKIFDEFCFGKTLILISSSTVAVCTFVEQIYIIEVMKAADKNTVKKNKQC
jgi:hypothetical protein